MGETLRRGSEYSRSQSGGRVTNDEFDCDDARVEAVPGRADAAS